MPIKSRFSVMKQSETKLSKPYCSEVGKDFHLDLSVGHPANGTDVHKPSVIALSRRVQLSC